MSDIEKSKEPSYYEVLDFMSAAHRSAVMAVMAVMAEMKGYQHGADVEAQAADEARAEVRRLKAENESLRKQVARLKSENQSLLEDPGSAL